MGRGVGHFVRAQGRIGAALALAMPASLAPAKAGFVQPRGTTEVISTTGTSGFNRSFDARGAIRRSGTFAKSSLDVHASHGLSDRLALVGQLSSAQLQADVAVPPETHWSGLAGVRGRLWTDGATILSSQVLLGAAKESRGAGFAADARLLLGRSFSLGTMPGFADLQFGYRRNAPGARPELRLDGTFGLWLHPNWLALGQIFATHGLREGAQPPAFRVKASLGLVWRISDRWSAQVAGFTTLVGRDAGRESGVALSLWRRF